ncbi:hemerythrin domain-containing protein [Pseudoalteromonas sp. T1lg23B]|uniref:hemerythrin domain-containing protein n=1 Tax=Pseudoalteromonas sp. T1lg23B TaxID=2077097 RepID=UPI000CF7392C|nr:hemerythrin domain-containing protein [Pseudoalteromonas sp. T1lg23B]
MNIAQSTIQELAVNIPGATELFDSYQINYTKQQGLLLKDIAETAKISLFDLIDKLESLLRAGPHSDNEQWRTRPVCDLIAHILENFHEKHRVQLSEAIRLTQKVANAHGDHPNFPYELEALLTSMQFDLEEHMIKEERILFPMMESGMHPSGPISVMMSEHVDHAKTLEQLKLTTNAFSPPAEACNSWTTLYKDLQALYFDLKEHIHLENDILFSSKSELFQI